MGRRCVAIAISNGVINERVTIESRHRREDNLTSLRINTHRSRACETLRHARRGQRCAIRTLRVIIQNVLSDDIRTFVRSGYVTHRHRHVILDSDGQRIRCTQNAVSRSHLNVERNFVLNIRDWVIDRLGQRDRVIARVIDRDRDDRLAIHRTHQCIRAITRPTDRLVVRGELRRR